MLDIIISYIKREARQKNLEMEREWKAEWSTKK